MKRLIAATLAALVLSGAVVDAHKGDKKGKSKKDKNATHASHAVDRESRNGSIQVAWGPVRSR